MDLKVSLSLILRLLSCNCLISFGRIFYTTSVVFLENGPVMTTIRMLLGREVQLTTRILHFVGPFKVPSAL